MKDSARKLIESRLGGNVRYERAFARIAGGVVPGLFLSQAWYWTQRTPDQSGWFYKTMLEWTDETGLTRCEQETAREKLRSLGILVEERRGTKGRLHFKINTRKLYETLPDCGKSTNTKPANKTCEKPQTGGSRLRETDISDCGKSTYQNAGNTQTLPIYKTTTKTTSESLTSPSAPRASRLSENWDLPDSWREDAQKERGDLDLDLDLEALKFRDYWIGKAGRDATKLDWRATWRNWVRNAATPKSPSSVKRNGTSSSQTLNDMIAEEMAGIERRNGLDKSNPG